MAEAQARCAAPAGGRSLLVRGERGLGPAAGRPCWPSARPAPGCCCPATCIAACCMAACWAGWNRSCSICPSIPSPVCGCRRSPERLERVLAAALAQGPVAALVLVDPTYQGLVADLPAQVALAHRAGLPVLVDQAHGRRRGPGRRRRSGGALPAEERHGPGPERGPAGPGGAGRCRRDRKGPALAADLQPQCPAAGLLGRGAGARGHGRRARARGSRAEARAARLQRPATEALAFPLVANGDPLRLVLATAPLGINGLEADAWLLARGVTAELPEPGALTFCLGLDPPTGSGATPASHCCRRCAGPWAETPSPRSWRPPAAPGGGAGSAHRPGLACAGRAGSPGAGLQDASPPTDLPLSPGDSAAGARRADRSGPRRLAAEASGASGPVRSLIRWGRGRFRSPMANPAFSARPTGRSSGISSPPGCRTAPLRMPPDSAPRPWSCG